MDEKVKNAYSLFYEHKYSDAKDIFIECGLTYEAGISFLLLKDLVFARKFFEIKKDICPASDFGLIILNIIEDKPKKQAGYFQVRSFLEIYINLFIENNLLEWAQKIINSYEFFTHSNIEAPKFIARVLDANNCTNAIHSFARLAKELCFYDAEIHYIDANTYILENNFEAAKSCIEDCLKIAPEYYPILRLKYELEQAIKPNF